MAERYILSKYSTNRLLQKDDIGKSKSSTYNLPDVNFAFGKSSIK